MNLLAKNLLSTGKKYNENTKTSESEPYNNQISLSQ